MVNTTPHEHVEQVLFCRWLYQHGIIHASIPNGSYKSRYAQGKFKAEGLKAGFPDMVVFLNDVIVFIEMKRQKGSTISKEQKEWQEKINSYGYARAYVCYGCEDAKSTIGSVLNERN